MNGSVVQAARYFKVHVSTVRRWIRAGCPCLEEGSVGRTHGSRLDFNAVQHWLTEQRVPMLAQQAQRDELGTMATALYDCLKRDGLMGQTLPAELMVGKIYKRLYKNLTKTDLQWQDVPEELKRVCANYLDSVEAGKFQRR
jgi:hypothetical protein